MAAAQRILPSEVSVRKVQQSLLDQHAYIMPYIDVPTSDPHFQAIQRIGATGLLRGTGIPYKWANQTWFYPDSLCTISHLKPGVAELYKSKLATDLPERPVTAQWLARVMADLKLNTDVASILDLLHTTFPAQPAKSDTPLSRRQVAVVLDSIWQPFLLDVDHQGHLIKTK